MFVAARWDRAAWIPRLKKSVKSVGSNDFQSACRYVPVALFPRAANFSLPSPYPHGTRENRPKTRFLCRDRNTIMVCFGLVESAPLSPLKIERNFSLRFDSRLVIDLSPNFPIFRSKSYLVFPPFAISRAFKIHLFFFSF